VKLIRNGNLWIINKILKSLQCQWHIGVR